MDKFYSLPSEACLQPSLGIRSTNITIMPEGAEGIDHERVVIRQDPDTGMRLIVAVHSTVLGPALGGMRLREYPGGIEEALTDVLELARTMTLKASAAGLDLGGGKAVMVDDGATEMREARLRKAAQLIDELGGAYITAEDIGTTTADMDLISRHTRWVVGRSEANGGRGDPSPVTAETVRRAMERGLAAATGSPDLDGRVVGIVGLGKVGMPLARGLVDGRVAGALTCRVVCGAANNPLGSPAVAARLASRGVLYVPDFLANCGGLISVAAEWTRGGDSDVERHIATAMGRLDASLEESARTGEPPAVVAERQALERIANARDAARNSALVAAA